jgi:CTD small phosphatase-like protein 2
VRPFCLEFIKELSTFAEIIIFTASAASYADVVLDYLDPQKRYF